MKRIEFIAPVEAMRGNLSGNQELTYGENQKAAYDGEVGKVEYANAYSPRFVGAKRSIDGKKYFQVRTKSAVGLTVKSKNAMALLGGSSLCFLSVSKDLAHLNDFQAAYLAAKVTDPSLSFRKWLQGICYEMLALKMGEIAAGETDIINPFSTGGASADSSLPVLPQDKFLKFFPELFVVSDSSNPSYPIEFSVDGRVMAAQKNVDGNILSGIIPNRWNEGWHIGYDLMSAGKEVIIQDQNTAGKPILWLKDENNAYVSATAIKNGGVYTTTEQAPA